MQKKILNSLKCLEVGKKKVLHQAVLVLSSLCFQVILPLIVRQRIWSHKLLWLKYLVMSHNQILSIWLWVITKYFNESPFVKRCQNFSTLIRRRRNITEIEHYVRHPFLVVNNETTSLMTNDQHDRHECRRLMQHLTVIL
jgi:hypothetical protein